VAVGPRGRQDMALNLLAHLTASSYAARGSYFGRKALLGYLMRSARKYLGKEFVNEHVST
jgi:hypothetical protein